MHGCIHESDSNRQSRLPASIFICPLEVNLPCNHQDRTSVRLPRHLLTGMEQFTWQSPSLLHSPPQYYSSACKSSHSVLPQPPVLPVDQHFTMVSIGHLPMPSHATEEKTVGDHHLSRLTAGTRRSPGMLRSYLVLEDTNPNAWREGGAGVNHELFCSGLSKF